MGSVPAASYKKVTADGVICGQSGYLTGIVFEASATGILYDNSSAASGNVVYSGGSSISFAVPVAFFNGLYLDITGTGATVYFIPS